MAKISTDPLDGPTIDTSRPVSTAKKVGMYMVGAGVFFALLTASQATVQPLAGRVLSMVPGVNAGENVEMPGTNGGGL